MNSRSATVVATALAATAVLAVVAFVAWPGSRSADFGATLPGDPDLSANDVVPAITARNLGPKITFRSAAPQDVAKYAPAVPESLAIPAVGLAMKVEAKGLASDGSMALPDVAAVAAWYSHGAVPGDRDGAALIAAHVATDADGVGPFSRLGDLHSGDTVAVTLTDGSQHSFVVVKRQLISKQAVDYDSIIADSAGMLVLITCGGTFDVSSRHYDDNVIVWAASTEVP